MLPKKKLIIDTDIGDDIDDAIALYAAMRNEFEIIGITTVFRNTADRARQAKKLLTEYGNGYERVPVYAGYGTPIGAEAELWPHIPHYTPDLEQNSYEPESQNPADAVDFIIESSRRWGTELVLLAIGPFTNIAKAIEKDAAALNSISRVVIMGGAYYRQYADWNVMCDVEAADIMFRSLDNLECIGADVTHLTVSEERLYENLMHHKGSERAHRYLSQLCAMWRTECPQASLVLHDPLAVYYLANGGLCSMRAASVIVITDGYARGLTLNVDAYTKKAYNPKAYVGFDDTRKALVATAVDLDAFNALIFNDFHV